MNRIPSGKPRLSYGGFRLAEAKLVVRQHDEDDRRRVRVGLTKTAERHLGRLSAIHLEELRRLRPVLLQILGLIGEAVNPAPAQIMERAPEQRGLSRACP
jgi:DNA-binding MarR family transcriptional regulator